MVTTLSPDTSELALTEQHGEYIGDLQRAIFYCESSENMSHIPDASVHLTVTSPPYWSAIDYDVHVSDRTAWHRNGAYNRAGNDFDDWLTTMERVFAETLRVTAPGGFCAVVMGSILKEGRRLPLPQYLTVRMCDIGWEFQEEIVWNKVTGGVGRAGSFIQHPRAGYYYPNIMTESILVFRREGEKRRGSAIALPIDDVFTRDIANNIWHIAPVPPKQIEHPCPFPSELVRRLVRLYSDEGDTVLDPFVGSGTTVSVAVREDRYGIGYDIEQTYIDIAREMVIHPPTPRKNQLIPAVRKVAVR